MTQNKLFILTLLALLALAKVLTSEAYVVGAQLEADGYAAFADKLSGRLDLDTTDISGAATRSAISFKPAQGERSLTSFQESA